MKHLLSIYNHRGPLLRTKAALRQGSLTIGFVGGSITEGSQNWPESVVSWFQVSFPKVSLVVENIAIGATGSDLAAFRAKRDLVDRACDLIFVEYAVNDNEVPTQLRNKTREGLLRQILATGMTDVVLAYTFCRDMYEEMRNEQVPASIQEFEALGEHYGLSSVWMGLHALREVQAGQMRWEEWLPDGLHPQQRGSFCYAQSVVTFLKEELGKASHARSSEKLPRAMDPDCWDNLHLVPLTDLKTEGPWVLRRWAKSGWLDQVLTTASPGSRITFSFTGRGLALIFDFGKTSSELRYRVDGGEWKASERNRPDWCPASGWLRLFLVGDEFARKKHDVEIEVIHGNRLECIGTNFDLGMVGIIE